MELCKEFVGCLTFQFRHKHSALTERISRNHTKTTRLSDDGKAVSLNLWQREEATHSHEFLTRVASYNSSLTEQFIGTFVVKVSRAGMMVCSTCATLCTTRLYGCYAASLRNKRLCMTEQSFGVSDALDIQDFSTHILRRVEVLIQILKHILNTSITSVSDTPYGIKS